jgi:cell division protein FtsZ
VYNLGEEIKEDNFEFISATEFIKNIEVVYEEIAITKPSDFVITDVTPQVEAIVEEEIKEEQQISFTFDMPLASKPLVEKSEEKAKIEIRNLDVYDHKEIPSTPKVKEEEVYFSLEDYTELEENLTKAVKPLSNISIESEEELKITVKSLKTIDINEQEVIDHKEVSPLDLTISELQKRSAERREKMKHFNYKFINKLKSNIDEIEREPAYKRMGVKLDNTAHSSEIKTSRTTLEIDENDDIQFRSNNSFLHDNVD